MGSWDTVNSLLSLPITWANLFLFSLHELPLCFLFFAAWSIPMATPVCRVFVKAKSEPGMMPKILRTEYSQARDSGCQPLVCPGRWILTNNQHCLKQNSNWYNCWVLKFCYFPLFRIATARVHLVCSILPLPLSNRILELTIIFNVFSSLLGLYIFLETLKIPANNCGENLCCKEQYHVGVFHTTSKLQAGTGGGLGLFLVFAFLLITCF